jgi:PTH1 family peptidyl-tRNA hydrolase
MPIKLLAGLGNPGSQYRDTRHNAGFWVAERYAAKTGAPLAMNKGFNARVGRHGSLWIALPDTFMNRSGFAVGGIARFYKIAPEEILVVHDELDLLPGTVKFKRGGGHAGHNGLRDITSVLGTGDFWRLRIGIGHPRSLAVESEVANFVLNAPRRDEETAINESIDRALAVLPQFIDGDADGAMMNLHTRP